MNADTIKPAPIKAVNYRTGIHEHRSGHAGATAPDQRPPGGPDRHFRSASALRYQVYCLECGFLSPNDYSNGLETDEYDATAAHFYALDAQGDLVAYVRLVRPDSEQRFPFQKHCATTASATVFPRPDRAAEISRLMLRSDYRRLRHASDTAATTAKKSMEVLRDKRREAPQILLNLYRQMYAYSRSHGIEHWYAAMERPLAQSLQRLNMAFRPIGPETDYYGAVTPYLASLQALESQLCAGNPDLLAWLQQTERRSENRATAKIGAPVAGDPSCALSLS